MQRDSSLALQCVPLAFCLAHNLLLHRTAGLVARRKTLFDDRPVEISELTYIIKHDIAAINRQLADLQAFNKAQKAGGSKGPRGQASVDEHRGNVVTLLQTKLAGATTSFKDILEVRTQVSRRLFLIYSFLCLRFVARHAQRKERSQPFGGQYRTSHEMHLPEA